MWIVTNLIFTIGMCISPKIINYTTTWTNDDKANLIVASRRCGEIFPDAECLHIFIKKEERIYNIICGSRKRK
jgi:hypothetical protein